MPQTESFSFLVLILIAFVIVKRGFDTKALDNAPKLLFNLFMPALILTSFSGMDGEIAQRDAIFVAAFSVVFTLAVYPVARYLVRNHSIAGRKEPLAFNMILGNSSFVGLPFISFFFGIWGVRLTVLFAVVQDFFIWSLCYSMFAGTRSAKQTLKVVLNPCFIAICVSFALAALGLEIPQVIRPPLDMLAGMMVPLALLCIGSLLAQNTAALKNIDRDVIVSVAIKTFGLPAVVFAVLMAIGIDRELVLLATFITALPAGLLSVMFAKEFKKDIAFANVAFVLSTLTFILCCVALFIFI